MCSVRSFTYTPGKSECRYKTNISKVKLDVGIICFLFWTILNHAIMCSHSHQYFLSSPWDLFRDYLKSLLNNFYFAAAAFHSWAICFQFSVNWELQLDTFFFFLKSLLPYSCSTQWWLYSSCGVALCLYFSSFLILEIWRTSLACQVGVMLLVCIPGITLWSWCIPITHLTCWCFSFSFPSLFPPFLSFIPMTKDLSSHSLFSMLLSIALQSPRCL